MTSLSLQLECTRKSSRVREDLRELGYAAYSYFSHGPWQLKLMFRCQKMDTTDPVACSENAAKYRIDKISIKVRDSDIGERIPLSSSSFLKIVPVNSSNTVDKLRSEPF